MELQIPSRRQRFIDVLKLFPELHLDVDRVMYENDISILNDRIEEAKMDTQHQQLHILPKLEAAVPNHFETYLSLRDDFCNDLPVYSCVKNIVKNIPTSKYIKMNPMFEEEEFKDPNITDWYLDYEGYDDSLGLVHMVS